MPQVQYRCLAGHVWPATVIEERADGTLAIDVWSPGWPHPTRLSYGIRRGHGLGMVVGEPVDLPAAEPERTIPRETFSAKRRSRRLRRSGGVHSTPG